MSHVAEKASGNSLSKMIEMSLSIFSQTKVNGYMDGVLRLSTWGGEGGLFGFFLFSCPVIVAGEVFFPVGFPACPVELEREVTVGISTVEELSVA